MGHICIKGLRKTYLERRRNQRNGGGNRSSAGDSVLVLDDLNLEFQKGEMVCVLGPSGCGKTSLLRIIAGFDPSYSGEILIDGKPLKGPNSNNIFIFQHGGLLPWMTVRQNVGLGLRNIKDKAAMDETIREYIEMVELEGFEHHYPYQLSGGMQRRAELARALAVNPNLLIMDEPFSGLDFLTHMKMREEVVNMHGFFGKTTLLVTHDIDDALIMGDRIVVLSGRPSTVKMEQKLDFPHPRDFENDPELSRLRSEIFIMLGVPYAV